MPLRPATSAVARKTMKAAQDQLERMILPEDSHNFTATKLEDVRSAALLIETQLAARKSLRHMKRLEPLFNGLEHYGHIISILCNGTQYLSWIWAPIALILRIASEYVEAFECIMKGYAEISESLKRFKVLSKVCATNLDMQETLAVYYADILQFHTHAYKFVRRKSWTLLFSTSWGRFERQFKHILADMKKHGELVDKQASAHGVVDIRETREEIKSWREESLAAVQKANEKKASKEFASIVAWLKAEESDQLAILDTVSNEAAKFSGTCDWALKNDRIKSWLQKNPEPATLWLRGSPGSGKSVLMSQIVRFMRAGKMFLIHHFCTHRHASSIAYEQILRSILLQILRKDDELTSHVCSSYVENKTSPTVQTLEKLICKLFNIASSQPRDAEYIWIMIDGLNECEPRIQTSVVNLVKQINRKKVESGDTVCKILISSRHSPQIEKLLGKKHIMSLTEEKSSLRLAIRNYVSQRLLSMHERLHQLGLTPKDRDNIVNVITNKADGMFLYARLVLDYLSKNIFWSGKEMKESIDELPSELGEFYKRILLQILVQLDPRSVERIRCIFGWIAFSKRPLRRMEFLSALTFSPGEPEVSSLVPKYILDICGTLVEERPDTTLTFIHITVKDFLQGESSNLRIDADKAAEEHCLSALACLVCGADTFLNNNLQHDQAQRVAKGLHGFHVYATEFWTELILQHAATVPLAEDSKVLKLATRLAERLVDPMENGPDDSKGPPQAMDDRIQAFSERPLIKRLLEISLASSTVKRLETKLLHELQHGRGVSDMSNPVDSRRCISQTESKKPPPNPDRMSMMLSTYQEIVKILLNQESYPGISGEELETFKSQFRNAAFTCRLKFCHRATTGFNSEELRRQHELAHTQVSICSVPECRYPPFQSLKALRNHINKLHSTTRTRRPIRPPGSLRSTLTTRSSRASRPSASPELGSAAEDDLSSDSNRHMRPARNSTPPYMHEASGSFDAHLTKASRKDSMMSDSGKSEAMDEIDLESMGLCTCSISGCSTTLKPRRFFLDGKKQRGYAEVIEDHYWNFHHADTMMRCVITTCDMIFGSSDGLQAHYEQRHTVLMCNQCTEYPEGFTMEADLRHHWRFHHHLKLTKQWICEESTHDAFLHTYPIEMSVPWDQCELCLTKHKFETKEEAVAHLQLTHFANSSELGPLVLLTAEKFVRHVWVYETDEPPELTAKAEHEDSDDEDEEYNAATEPGSLFYNPELA